MSRPRISLVVAILALVPAVAGAAPKWDNQQNSGASGKVTTIELLSPGLPTWTQLRGAVRIGVADYQWGGTSCETDLTSYQVAALQLALVHGLTLTPTYRSVTGAGHRCLVAFSITK